jgi:hypothetical protein
MFIRLVSLTMSPSKFGLSISAMISRLAESWKMKMSLWMMTKIMNKRTEKTESMRKMKMKRRNSRIDMSLTRIFRQRHGR